MLRIPLESLCLSVKAALPGGEPLQACLARLISPPAPEAVDAAVRALTALGALDEDEALTPLGRHLCVLPMDARLAKTLIYAVLLRCGVLAGLGLQANGCNLENPQMLTQYAAQVRWPRADHRGGHGARAASVPLAARQACGGGRRQGRADGRLGSCGAQRPHCHRGRIRDLECRTPEGRPPGGFPGKRGFRLLIKFYTARCKMEVSSCGCQGQNSALNV